MVSGMVLILAVAAVFFFVPFSQKEGKHYSGPPKTKEEAIELIQRDSDGDGLKDWEEKIYGTNAEKADTDGDGTPDGEEIKLSRNPLITGPEDKLSIPLPPPTNGNKTEALANELIGRSFTQIIAENFAGGEAPANLSDVPELNSYVKKLGEEHPLDKVIPSDSREFKVSQDNSPEAVKRYFNAVFKINYDNFSSIDSDITVLHLAASGNNAKAFRRLDVNIAALEKAIKETKDSAVPSEWVAFAKDYVWSLSKTLAAVKILRNSENDPVSSLIVLNDRVRILSDINLLYLDTKTRLAETGIVFGKNDPAALALSSALP